MHREIAEMLVRVLSPLERKAFQEFRSFVDALDDLAAAARLADDLGVHIPEQVQHFAEWMRRRGIPPESRKAALEAVAAVTSKAERLGLTEQSIVAADFDPRIFRSAPRALRQNGGDRRSNSVQLCDRRVAGGTVDYFLARLERDRADLLDAYRRGEIPSVRQAAIRAGWLKPKLPPVQIH